jgi:UDP-2,4-diacetamido-2,4,6-trideoxy-beta-L-altropyranose hydrolase
MPIRTIKIAFLVDCGGAVGWGHFVRSHALAAELQESGALVLLAVRGFVPTLAAAVPLRIVAPEESVDFMRSSFVDADLVVLDLFDWRPEELTVAQRHRTALLACIRDKTEPPVAFDVWIDPNVSSGSVAGTLAGPTVLAGSDYVILRREFDALPSRAHAEVPQRLLVAFGGSDQSRLIELLIEALGANDLPFREIIVVLGGSRAPSAAPDGIELRALSHVHDMVTLYQWADLAVLASGTMFYEAAAAGLPCAVIPLNNEQRVEANAFAACGASLDLGDATAVRPAMIAAALRLTTGRMSRQSLALAARRTLDGGGRKRVAETLLAHLRATGRRMAP